MKINLLKLLSIVIVSLMTLTSSAQYSTIHYIPPSPWQYNNNANELEITTLSTTPVAVTIKSSDGTVITNSVTTVSGTPLQYRFPTVGVSANILNTVLNGRGLIISAVTPIGVQVRNIASDNVTCSGACYGTTGSLSNQQDCTQKGNSSFTSLGDQGLGTSFRVGYYANVVGSSWNCNNESQVPIYGIMARDNGTNIYLNGSLITTLGAGQCYLLQTPIGSQISSNNPIVCTSGFRIDNTSGCGDGVCSQMIPEAYLGTSYIIVRSSGNTGYERSTIVATQANTTVTVKVNGGGTTNYTLAKAGDYVTINNGDGSTAYSSCYVSSSSPVAVYTGSASGCEIDMIVQPPLSLCAGSFNVQTTKFISNTNTGNTALPYFGYILVESDTAVVYFNGVNLETLTSKRTAVANSNFYIIQFTNSQLGNPTNLNFTVNARVNVAMVESGGGYSMSSFISSMANTMPPPGVTSNCLPATFTAQSGFASYQWYKDGTLVSGVTTQTYSPTLTGNYSVAGNSLSCGSTSISPTVAVSGKPNAGVDQAACSGTSVTLTGTTPSTATWAAQTGNPSGATLGSTSNGIASVVLANTAVGNYNFIYNAGCTDTMMLTVKAISTSTTNATICSNSSYNFNGTTYTTSGTYVAHLTNSVGCDSAATLNLTVKQTSTSTKSVNICAGSSYTFNGTTYTTSGAYTAHLTNSVGCDSAATLVLTVNPNSASTTNASICTGGSYTFNGTTYTIAGTYVAHLTNSVGCDSAATLVLKVNAPSASTTNASICNGSSYTFNGVAYTSSGTYVAHLINAVGCDSAATLVLIVKANSTSTTNASIISGNSYTFNGTSYTNAGTYLVHLTNSAGCDSAATLVLTVTTISSTSASICNGGSYPFNGTNYTTSGTYTALLKNSKGGDSLATLILTVKPTSTSTTYASICSGGSYTFNGTTYSAAGSYTAHLTNSVGCDSAATLVLTVKALSISTTNASICSGSSYTFNGTTYTTAGTYTAHLTNAVGCDSAATLVLTIKSLSTSTTNASICNGGSYTFNGTTYTTAGNYVAHLTNAVGCDSAATLVLSVKYPSTSTTNASICTGGSYSFNGSTYTTAGTYFAHLTNAVGCDSAATLVLRVNTPTTSTTTASICTGGSYSFNGTSYTTAGTYVAHLINAAGCDSAATLVLSVKATSTSTTNKTISLGSSYTFNGTNYTSAGTYTAHLTNAVGCDSAATLVLTVISYSTTTASICNGSSYTFNGSTYTTAGTYTATLKSVLGIDSVATLVLTVKSLSTSTTNASICNGGSYTFNGTTYTSAGTYTAHLTNAVGCDSAATLILTVKATSTSTTYASICAGASYTFNGTTYTSAGTYVAHSTNSVGCDSSATLVLTVKSLSTSTTIANICNGSSYTFNGSVYTAAGTYVAHLTNAVGCDSAATLILSVKYPSISTTNASICAGGSYTFNGTSYTTAGTYVAHLTNAVGCDSAANLILKVNQPSTSTTNASICAGSSYSFNGSYYTNAGTYVAHLTNSVGCDSAATLILSIKTTSTSTTYATIALGNSYTFNGTAYTSVGSYTAHLTNSVGCDSAATLVLTVISYSSTTASICSGSSYTFNGSTYTSAGTYTAHLKSVSGIDSIATLVLTVKQISTSTTYASICNGGSYTFNGTAYTTAGTYTYHTTNSVGCDSAASLVLTVKSLSTSTTNASICNGGSYTFNGTTYSTAGTYTAHLTNAVGCDSAATLVLNVKSLSTSTTNASICSGSSYTFNGTAYTTSGTYVAHLTNAVGCDSAATLNLTVKAKSSSTTNASICSGSSYTFNGTAYTTSGTYTVHFTNAVGCDSSAILVLTVNANPTVAAIVGDAAICQSTTKTYSDATSGGVWSSSMPSAATISSTGVITGVSAGAATITYTVTSAAGCVSSVTKSLTINSAPAVTPITGTTNLCVGTTTTLSDASFGGSWSSSATGIATISSAGVVTGVAVGNSTITYSLSSASGCTTSVTTPVSVGAATTSTTNASICAGGSYTFNGTIYTTAGTYTAHLTNAVGCDSAANLVLTVKSLSTSTTNASICAGGSYIFNGTTYTTAGTYTAHLTNAVGCDSAAALVLTVKSLSISTTNASICAGGSYTFNGTTYTTAGTYTAHLTNAVGCDSAATLVLTVKSLSTSTTNASICNGGSYTFNGNTYTTAGTYTAHLTNAVGCDSAATLVLTVKPLSTSTTYVSICNGGSYTFNGSIYTTAGNYLAHLTNAVGCDSSATLILTVKSLSTSTTNASICAGGTYTFNGITYTTAGTYTAHLTNAIGCDSAATLILTVKSLSTSTTNASICAGGTYTFNGTTYTTAGTYTAHLTNAVGCDSAATLVLTVKSLSTSTTYASICNGGSYTFNGSIYTTAGTYTAHLTNAVGCDSAATLVLTVKSLSTSTTNASICAGGSYTFNGTTYTTAGTYTAHLTNSVGCDSTATLVLTVKSLSTSTTNASICNGGSYTFNGITYTTAGTYTAHLTNAVGCDSAATLVLTVKANSTSSTNITACSSYNWNGVTYTTSGTYIYHALNAVGCDSTATLNLIINQPSTSSTNITSCSSYLWNGNTYTTSGIYTYHTLNAVGCDSTAILNLNINQPSTSSTNITACSSYTWNGVTYTTSGTYTYHTLNAVGCDSTAILNLTINQPSTSNTKITACSSYTWNGVTYTTSGTYTYKTINAVGCDSTATLNLTINQPTTSSTKITACSSYVWNGTTYTASGTYTYSTTNAVGCDSTSTLYLIINQPSTSNTNITACSSYVWNGTTYTASGTYTYHALNVVGCDSIATLVLTINHTTTSSTNITACSSYVWNGTTYTTSGTYTYHTVNAVGCDSTATLNLTINQPTTSITNITVCSSYVWNGVTYTTSGTYIYHTLNAVGCDSTANLVLTINQPTTSSTNITACSSYIWNGVSYTTSGTYNYHTLNAVGCDSTATLNLTINQPSTSNTNITACSSYTWNGVTYTTSGTYMYHALNAVGCDSTATLNLTINQPTTSSTNVTVCSSYVWNGVTYTTSGIYTYHALNAVGCDSIATLNLTINQPTTSSTNVTACSSYVWNGVTYRTSGTYTYNTLNAVGCDSTATLNLIINQPSTSSTNITACSSYVWNGTTYTTSGTYTYSTTNAVGCDSTATLNLTIYQPSSSITTTSICTGGSYNFNGSTYTTAGTYTAHLTNAAGCDSIATLVLSVNSPSTSTTTATICDGTAYLFNGVSYTTAGTYVAHLTNSVGCDSAATLVLTVNPLPAFATISGKDSLCAGSAASFSASIASGTWSIANTSIASIDIKGKVTGLAAGKDTISYSLTNSCGTATVSKLIIVSTTLPSVQLIAGTSTACPGLTTTLTDASLGGYWTSADASIATVDSISGIVTGVATGTANIAYTVVASNGCANAAVVPFTVNCGSVTSAGDGGLESKSMGEAVANRVYNRALANTVNTVDYNALTPVKNNIAHIGIFGITTPGSHALTDFMPSTNSMGNGFSAYDMSSGVADLSGITNASIAKAYDYVANNSTKSATLITRTYNLVYQHTKPICDRLKEAKLLDVRTVTLKGMDFLQYKLLQNSGQVEYAISFSAGIQNNVDSFRIQSIWLTKNFINQDTMYNFQIWAVDPVMAENMLTSVLNKLNNILPLSQINKQSAPVTYISSVTRNQNKLILNINNKSTATSASLNLNVTSNEISTAPTTQTVPVSLFPNAMSQVVVDLQDNFESDVNLFVNGNQTDLAYINDGNWNYSLSSSSIKPNDFTVTNDGKMPDSGEFRLFRTVHINANVPDYVSVYKLMKAGGLSRDLSGYTNLLFTASASGAGSLRIVIQKNSISNWNNQYSYTMPISANTTSYGVRLRDFTSPGSTDTLTADDVVTVTFSFISNGSGNIDATIYDAKFTQKDYVFLASLTDKSLSAFPNPAKDHFDCVFKSNVDTKLKLKLIQIGTGRVVFTQEINAVAGENSVPVMVGGSSISDGYYVLQLANESATYTPYKMLFKK